MDKDQINTGGIPTKVRQAAFKVISRTQASPTTQVQGMALALFATCNALDIDIRELLESMERMQRDLSGAFTSTFDAIEAYALNEIGRR